MTGPTDPGPPAAGLAVLDYEGELGFVIGRRCRHVSRDDAADVIAGYLVVNDVDRARLAAPHPHLDDGKSFDTHGPIGPWIVTPDELRDPHQLRLRTWVNDELRQESNTKELIFDCFTLVEHLLDGLHTRAWRHHCHGDAFGGVGIASRSRRIC